MESVMHDATAELVGCERIMVSLAESASRPLGEVKVIFAREYARLAEGAKIRAHLPALVASNVRSILRRAS